MKIPEIGLGTFRLKGLDAQSSVLTGLELGYQHIDTAQIYDNEQDVGIALKKSGVKRESIFLTTKIWTECLSKEKLIPSLKESLSKLQTPYVDLTLIHWPSPNAAIPLAETLQALAEAREMGLSKEIGISNFPIAETKLAIEILGSKAIYTNQIEVHPYLQNRKLVDFCKAQGIQVTAYMPLAYGKVMQDPALLAIAGRLGVSVSDVVLSWLLSRDLLIIPSSTKRENLRRNLNPPRGILSSEDISQIEKLDRGERLANPGFSPKWD